MTAKEKAIYLHNEYGDEVVHFVDLRSSFGDIYWKDVYIEMLKIESVQKYINNEILRNNRNNINDSRVR